MMTRTDLRNNAARGAVLLAMLAVGQAPVQLTQVSKAAPALLAPPAPHPAPRVAAANPGVPAGAATAAAPAASQPRPLVDPFAPTSWTPPPAPPAAAPTAAALAAAAQAPAAVPAPSAPPLPFVYVGLYVEGGQETVMLMKGEQLLLVKQGDTIDNTYRLERVAADRIELTYLPLGTRQSVRTADAA